MDTSVTSEDGMMENNEKQVLRPKKSPDANIDFHCLPDDGGVLIKVTPPDDWEPDSTATTANTANTTTANPPHIPSDIVLVIDVSGSMSTTAPVPVADGAAAEDTGLSVLDLVKHASRTILETLNGDDRLAIVTFATGVRVVQPLTAMTPANKATTASNIAGMQPENSTNLWQGIMTGMKQFAGKTDAGRVPSIMVLTDGVPNFMSPAQGYIPKMRTLPPSPAPIHTFGFGYSLRSGLLKSISELTGGSYSFIPDAGMIGTVFVHAVANMQTTFATDAVIHLTVPGGVDVHQTLGDAVQKPLAPPCAPQNDDDSVVSIHVGTLQYGQSRDIYLRCDVRPHARADLSLKARLAYRRMTAATTCIETACVLPNRGIARDVGASWDTIELADCTPSALSTGEIDFHISRAMLCSFIAQYFPLDNVDEHVAVPYRPGMAGEVDGLIATLPATKPANAADAMCKALMRDVNGQVKLALSDPGAYQRWGRHYLPSLQGAHAFQQCNSFKDPGALLYAATSARFIACRDALDTAFDTLPPPMPTPPAPRHVPYGTAGTVGRSRLTMCGAARMRAPPPMAAVSMSSYRNAAGPCFASFCRATLASGTTVRVHRLRSGMQVQTPRGPRAVRRVLKTPVSNSPMVALGRLLITAWHPVSHNGADWVFPCQDKARSDTPVRYTGSIYSVLLEEDADAEAHAMLIEGLVVVTLGHGLTSPAHCANPDDVRIHSFLGDYAAVSRSLDTLDVRPDGLVINGGATRSNFHKWHTRK